MKSMESPFELPPDVLARVPLFAELSKVLSWRDGPVNWELARQIAGSVAVGEDRVAPLGGADHQEVTADIRIAELWLSETTGLAIPSHIVGARAATPGDWAEHAAGAYTELIEPIAAKVTRALSDHAPQGEGPEAMMGRAVAQIVPMFMGMQVGTILGTLAREVTGSGDVALPGSEGDVLIVTSAVDAVAADYHLDPKQARLWIALRETARRMVYDGTGWVRGHFFGAYHNYVASMDIDLAAGIERLQQFDLSDPALLQEALADETLFALEASPQTAAAASRVSGLLALIDAYTDASVEAAFARAGDPAPLAEAFRRRAVSEGRGARMFGGFIGLEAPRNRRATATFVREVLASGGWGVLNRMVEDADSLPSDEEIGDPAAWRARTAR